MTKQNKLLKQERDTLENQKLEVVRFYVLGRSLTLV